MSPWVSRIWIEVWVGTYDRIRRPVNRYVLKISHVHHENAFLKQRIEPHAKNLLLRSIYYPNLSRWFPRYFSETWEYTRATLYEERNDPAFQKRGISRVLSTQVYQVLSIGIYLVDSSGRKHALRKTLYQSLHSQQ